MALHWPNIDVKLRDLNVQTVASQHGGHAGDTDIASILAPTKPKKSGKLCKRCGAENRKGAGACVSCGQAFPSCTVCGRVLQHDQKFCECGIPYSSYY
jgi:hypothetical protein